MRTVPYAIALALLVLLSIPATKPAATAEGAAAANGGVTLSEDDTRRYVEFNAINHPDGSAHGKVSIRDTAGLPDQDVDGTGDPLLAAAASTELTADVDGLCVDGNKAVLAAVVSSASHGDYVGKRLLLVVEDNGEGRKADPDQITWGIYHRRAPRLVTDEENPGAGAFLVGGQKLVRDEENPDAGEFLVDEGDVNCKSFPLDGYTLTPVSGGNARVRP